MSNEDNAKQEDSEKQTVDSAKYSISNLISSLLSLKEKNPKVFFGGIGGIVILLIIMMMSGGSSKPTLTGPVLKDLAVGQRYVLKSANAYDPAATVRLVSTPGTIAAYDDTEETDRTGACQHMPQGTPITVLDFADAYGKQKAYAKVKIEEGECKGNEGWALAIDVQ
ncbi:MAG: hypothetical protein PHD43_03760 [Methylococcales bacterium]|nr:hypothetical protein [Methylococcales bacterium]